MLCKLSLFENPWPDGPFLCRQHRCGKIYKMGRCNDHDSKRRKCVPVSLAKASARGPGQLQADFGEVNLHEGSGPAVHT